MVAARLIQSVSVIVWACRNRTDNRTKDPFEYSEAELGSTWVLLVLLFGSKQYHDSDAPFTSANTIFWLTMFGPFFGCYVFWGLFTAIYCYCKKRCVKRHEPTPHLNPPTATAAAPAVALTPPAPVKAPIPLFASQVVPQQQQQQQQEQQEPTPTDTISTTNNYVIEEESDESVDARRDQNEVIQRVERKRAMQQREAAFSGETQPCRICHNRPVNCIFLPCEDRFACSECAAFVTPGDPCVVCHAPTRGFILDSEQK